MRAARSLLLGLVLAACGGAPDVGPVDADGDGISAHYDCNDADPGVWQLRPGYLDSDRDGHGAGQLLQVCSGAQLPAGYSPTGGDCDDGDATAWRPVQAFADADGDGLGAGEPVTLCVGAALPPGFASQGGDCAPDDAGRWQELAYLYRDADGDGTTVAQEGLCAGADLPPGYTLSPLGTDCDDADPAAWSTVVAYADVDGDGAGSGPPLTLCTDGSIPPGHAAAGGDCAPGDAAGRSSPTRTATPTATAGPFRRPAHLLRLAAPGRLLDLRQRSRLRRRRPAAWQLLTAYLDADGDGVGAGDALQLCTGAALPPRRARLRRRRCDRPAR